MLLVCRDLFWPLSLLKALLAQGLHLSRLLFPLGRGWVLQVGACVAYPIPAGWYPQPLWGSEESLLLLVLPRGEQSITRPLLGFLHQQGTKGIFLFLMPWIH